MKPPPSGGGGGSIASDLKFLFSALRTRRRTKLFLYGFVFSFIACTAYMAFNPSSGSGSPWYSEFFATATASTAPYRSQFSSFFSRFFPPTGGVVGAGDNVGVSTEGGVLAKNQTEGGVGLPLGGVLESDQKNSQVSSSQNGILKRNQTTAGVGSSPKAVAKSSNQTRSADDSQNHQTGALKSSHESSGAEPPPPRDGRLGKNQTAVKTLPSPQGGLVPAKKSTGLGVGSSSKNGASTQKNQTMVGNSPQKNTSPAKNQTSTGASATTPSKSKAPAIDPKTGELPPAKNQSLRSSITAPPGGPSAASLGKSGQKGALAGNIASNLSVSLAKGGEPKSKQSSSFNSKGGQRKENWSLESMKSCDIFHGKWVKDDSYPLYPEGSCPHIDEPFNCYLNGRPDRSYQKLRWQPHGCNIPRLNATDMLERLRGKRLVFVGDSLNRNMWESLVCILRNSVKNKKNVFEASGRHEFRTEGSYSFVFKDYGCSVEFFRSPFLVQEWEMPDTNGKKKETLRLDIIERSSSRYKDADIIVFNTGHWWTHDKTSKGKDYYQEGNRIYSNLNVVEAFHKALNTWAKWVDVNINPHKTLVFFRGYSASHFSGGQWNSGGQCDQETEPIKNEKYLSTYPPKMSVLESVLKGMKTHISYLNITRMTDYRKEAHPSIYRKPHLTEAERKSPDRYQDCSHWCLPGVPDSWNELLYAQLLIKQHQL